MNNTVAALWRHARKITEDPRVRRAAKTIAFATTFFAGCMVALGGGGALLDALGIMTSPSPEACQLSTAVKLISAPILGAGGLGCVAFAMDHIGPSTSRKPISGSKAFLAGVATGIAGLAMIGMDLDAAAEAIGLLKSAAPEICKLDGATNVVAPLTFLVVGAGSLATATRLLKRALG